jgi:hypothetical protein
VKLFILVFIFCFIQIPAKLFGKNNPESWAVKATFSKDTILVGEPVILSLSAIYSTRSQVLFPDTGFVFPGFEVLHREYFPTKSNLVSSRDSVVYTLTSYEPGASMELRLPVFEFLGPDSVPHYSNRVTVFIKSTIGDQVPANPVLQTETSPLPVARKINYPFILLGLGVVILAILLVNLFFDRPIQKFIFLFLERRRFNAFRKLFDKTSYQMELQPSSSGMESLLNIWKKYIQRVDEKPYMSLTSSEIYKILPDDTLKQTLQDADRWIYGGVEMQDFRFNIGYLRQIASQLYQKKREAIRNGKLE